MAAPRLVIDGPADASLTVALAHGAGAPMDSPFMTAFARGLAERGWRVARFEFPYMAGRRDGLRRPPDRPEVLIAAWRAVVAELGRERLVIGGKSMGGRIASMVAAEAEAVDTSVRGLACLGYPFHAPGRTAAPRLDHLRRLRTPMLILQGTRDPFGTRDEVGGYGLPASIRLHWIDDGDHGFVPRRASGRTDRDAWDEALAVLDTFLAGIAAAPAFA